MRSFLFGASALLGLVSAAPAPVPQDIDFDLAYALPNPTYTTASDATAQIVTYNPSTVFSAALSQITASDTATALNTTTTDAALDKRSACDPQPTGYGPVPTSDTPAQFTAQAAISSAAVNAPVPSGYTQAFSNLNASNNAYGYMGYTNLKSYDSNACAAKCNAINGCISFNLYFERDPTLEPGSGCTNPPSTTNIKCVFWGGPVSTSNAVNYGQWRSQFQVVIAGSNGYVNNSVASVPGYTPATPLGNAAINAPYDQYGFNSYMGDAIFVGAFNAQLCADACTKKSEYALAHPPTDGTPVQTCQFFNTYLLYINTTSNVQGQYCAMYSESWPSSYATNKGQYRGNDHFMIEYSFSYSNATSPGSAQPLPAVYQAKKDILWPANSAQPYCSSLLGYTTPLTTALTSVTAISGTVSTFTTTVTTVTTTITPAAGPAKRQPSAAIAEPSVLSKYPASIVSSACQLAVTSPTVTSTISATTTVATSISTSVTTLAQTSTVTTSAAAAGPTFVLIATDSSSNTYYVGLARVGTSDSGVTYYALGLSDTSTGISFTIDPSNGALQIVNGPAGGDLAYYTSVGGGTYRVLAAPSTAITASGSTPLVCALDATGTDVQCQWDSTDLATFWTFSGAGFLFVSSAADGDPYDTVTLQVSKSR